MFSGKLVKVLGFMATVVGIGATLLTDWVNERKMDEMIQEKVNEAFTKYDEEKNEEFQDELDKEDELEEEIES